MYGKDFEDAVQTMFILENAGSQFNSEVLLFCHCVC